jgi:hypothetical protein
MKSIMDVIKEIVGGWLACATILLLISLLWAIIVWLTWNAIITELLQLPTISYWQSVLLVLLTSVLFNSDTIGDINKEL